MIRTVYAACLLLAALCGPAAAVDFVATDVGKFPDGTPFITVFDSSSIIAPEPGHKEALFASVRSDGAWLERHIEFDCAKRWRTVSALSHGADGSTKDQGSEPWAEIGAGSLGNEMRDRVCGWPDVKVDKSQFYEAADLRQFLATMAVALQPK